jgi:hypothetical protein
MPKKYTVEFELKGNGTDAEKAIKGVSGEVDKLDKSAKTAAKGGLKDADKAGGSLTKTFTSLKTPITAAITALVGLGSLNGIRLLAKDARDLDNAAQSLGIGVNTLSQYQYAFQQLNIDGSKTVDMFKDINERVGEFANTGGGELADIIKRTNLNIRELVTLSPDQQLLKIYDALEKIDGITQSEITAYLEQLVSDAAILQPLLANGAAELKRFAAEGEALGVTLDAIEVEKLRQADEEIRKLSASWSGLSNDLSIAFIPILTDVLGLIGDSAREMINLKNNIADTNQVTQTAGETNDFLAQAMKRTEQAAYDYIGASKEQRAEKRASIKADIAKVNSLIDEQKATLRLAEIQVAGAQARKLLSFDPLSRFIASLQGKHYEGEINGISTAIAELNKQKLRFEDIEGNLGNTAKLPSRTTATGLTYGQKTAAAKTSAQKTALKGLTEARKADTQAVKDAQKAQDELNQQAQLVTDTWMAHTAELERERFVLGKTTDEIYAYDLAQETVGKSKAKWTEEEIRWLVEFRKGTTARIKANEEQAKAQDLLNQKTEDSIRLQHEFTDIIDNELSSSLSRLVNTGVPLLDKLIDKFIEAAIQGRDLSSILGGGFGGGGGIGGFISSLFGGGSSYSPINAAGSTSGFNLNLPTFADGGYHSGGLRIVGENGPELEYTGPSQILNNASTSKLLNTGSNGSGVSLKVETHLHEDASKAGQVQQRSGADGKQIIDVFVSNIRSGGAAASALESSYLLKRQGR